MNYWIWLSQVDGLGPIQKMKLLDKFKCPEEIFKVKISEIEKIEGIRKIAIEGIENSKNIDLLKRYEEYILSHKIKLINIFDKEYPQALKEIYNPPITLFAKGNLNLLGKKSIAIVGCRDASIYGIKTAEEFAYKLSKENIVVISGLARGIDASAHIGSLRANGNTIAVLGCGIDICYPRENLEIYKKILNRGLIISEHIVGTYPKPEYFPLRNRIVSGLANGTLIVEAKRKSGSLITADLTLEQGREVYVVPGNISSQNSEGTNDLIKQGAKVVTSAQDIIEDLI